jgi:DNA-binding beta-propeller fold protein YncE
MSRSRSLTSLFAALLPLLVSSPAFAQAGPYKVINTVKVGGEGGYDYVTADADARRLYISRSGPAGVTAVYNLDTFASIGSIATGSAHGAIVDTASHHGFATSKPVTMFDAQTLAVIRTIDTGGNPDGFLADPVAHRVYILSHTAPQIMVLDARDGSIIGTIVLDGAPEQSVLDGKGHLYIDLEDKDSIAVADTTTLKVTATYDIKSYGGGCAGLAIDRAHGILFAACRDKSNMIIVNAATGKIITTLPTGVGCDGAVFNPATSEVFSTQGDGTLTVIKDNAKSSTPSASDFVVEQTVKTPLRARTITLDAKTGHLITITAEFGPAPAAVAGQRPARPPMVPGSFEIVVVGK